MTTLHKAALDAVSAALNAHDWPTKAETDIVLESTPGKHWEATEIHAAGKPVVYVSRIGRAFKQIWRGRWEAYPVVAVTVLHSVDPTGDTGQPDPEKFTVAESVLENVLPAVMNGLSSRFGIEDIEQPVGFDDDWMAKLIYVSQIVFTLNDGNGVK